LLAKATERDNTLRLLGFGSSEELMMAPNRVFFPQRALDQWLAESKIDLSAKELVIKAENRRYQVVEAVRVIQEVSGTEDLFDLVGKVKSVNYLMELGAEILETSMVLGDNAYEVVPGFLGAPVGSFKEHRAGVSTTRDDPLPKSEEALLAQYLMQTLE
jgi:hypothetical protein